MKLELRGITKRFGSVVANDGIDLVFEAGEVHCLLGENGAGKSTLMNLLFGIYRPDAGEILIDGRPVRFAGPRDAMAAGVGMVHQHFTLAPPLTVAENVVLGDEHAGRFGGFDRRAARLEVERLADRYGLEVPPDAPVEDLPVGVRQRVEILKALRRDARLLILDEPTAVLTPPESERLFEVMRELRADGRSIVFISHRLSEVRSISDRITVIRHGKVVGAADVQASDGELASMMVGRPVALDLERAPRRRDGATVLRLDRVSLDHEDGRPLLADLELAVNAGEVLGIAGVQGNGQAELVDLLMGRREPSAGTVELEGEETSGMSTREILARDVGYVPEDRKTEGLVDSFSIAENLILNRYQHAPFSRRGRLQLAAVRDSAEVLMSEYDIRAPGPDTAAGTLSGGNAQKVVLARELSRKLRLLVAVEPTRGIDVGSSAFVYRRILEVRKEGTAVVLISSNLDEVMALSDRIAVLYSGRIMAVLTAEDDRDRIGLLMTGIAA